jgi:hypothetical protein
MSIWKTQSLVPVKEFKRPSVPFEVVPHGSHFPTGQALIIIFALWVWFAEEFNLKLKFKGVYWAASHPQLYIPHSFGLKMEPLECRYCSC